MLPLCSSGARSSALHMQWTRKAGRGCFWGAPFGGGEIPIRDGQPLEPWKLLLSADTRLQAFVSSAPSNLRQGQQWPNPPCSLSWLLLIQWSFTAQVWAVLFFSVLFEAVPGEDSPQCHQQGRGAASMPTAPQGCWHLAGPWAGTAPRAVSKFGAVVSSARLLLPSSRTHCSLSLLWSGLGFSCLNLNKIYLLGCEGGGRNLLSRTFSFLGLLRGCFCST